MGDDFSKIFFFSALIAKSSLIYDGDYSYINIYMNMRQNMLTYQNVQVLTTYQSADSLLLRFFLIFRVYP